MQVKVHIKGCQNNHVHAVQEGATAMKPPKILKVKTNYSVATLRIFLLGVDQVSSGLPCYILGPRVTLPVSAIGILSS